VDAAEGPMPQSFFVLKKALARNLPIIVVINKIDKPMARCNWVLDQVFDLMVKLNAPDDILDFPVIYASARDGYANDNFTTRSGNMEPILDKIIEYIPAPSGDANGPLQLLISSLSYSPFLGRLAIGKITSGQLKMNQDVVVATVADGIISSARITKIYQYEGIKQVEANSATTGEVVAISGVENIHISETITDPLNPVPLAGIPVDPPTISMNFIPNDSPFAGKEGTFVTSRHIRDRLYRETLSDVALHVEDLSNQTGFKVSGRGELHLSIFIEKIRREGYEFQVSTPSVILKEENGRKMEPYEELTVDVAEEYMGKVIENLGVRKGQLIEIQQADGTARLKYKVPTRGLLGYQSEFMTETKGMGVMNYVFLEYGPYAGEIKTRKNGVIIAMENCTTVAYALDNIQERGVLFMGPAEKVYEGQIIGEHARENDIVVNPAKGKKLTNMRASGSDDAVILIPPRKMSLEQCVAYINSTELVEITPKSIRLRKVLLNENDRKKAKQI
jgi:GTP-binding protein